MSGFNHKNITNFDRANFDKTWQPYMISIIEQCAQSPSTVSFYLADLPAFKKWKVRPTEKLADAIDNIIYMYSDRNNAEDEYVLKCLFQALTDFEMGISFTISMHSFISVLSKLVKELSGPINLIGASVKGKILTHELLENYKIDTTKILLTKKDLSCLKDKTRYENLLTRLRLKAEQLKEPISENGYLDFRSLYAAVLSADVELLKKRLTTGVYSIDERNAAANTAHNLSICALEHENDDKVIKLRQIKNILLNNTPLHIAIDFNDLDGVKRLSNNISVNEPNILGQKPLYQAVREARRYGKSDIACQIIEELLKWTNSLEDVYDALCFQFLDNEASCLEAQLALLRRWREMPGHVDYKVFDENFNQSYMWYEKILLKALYSNDPVKVLSLLEDCVVDLDYVDKFGNNLLNQTLDLLSMDYNEKKFESVLDFLLSRKVNLNHQDQHGNTPLHTYAANNDLNIVRKLVKGGADVNMINHLGQTPLALAAKNREVSAEMIVLLTPSHVVQKNNKRLVNYDPRYFMASNNFPTQNFQILDNKLVR